MSVPPAPVCPPGFDCTWRNSCPKYYVECPDGYFCNSYEGYNGQGEMDYQYAKVAAPWQDITQENKEYYIDPDRAIQVKCLFGFFCSTSSDMKTCPEGYWCSESTVVPNKCDPLSICPVGSGFQINFMATMFAILMSIAMFYTSYTVRKRQRVANESSRLKEPSNSSSITPSNSGVDLVENAHTSHRHPTLVEVTFKDLLFQVTDNDSSEGTARHQRRDILPRINGRIPAGKLSVILGPTACGKSTLLNMIRKGGKHATSGSVSVSLVANREGIELGNSEIDSTDAPAKNKTSIVKERELTKEDFSKYMGYAPQEDILDRELTVRELLVFNIQTRLPHITDDREIHSIVDNVLSDLAIQHIADSVIGGGENMSANISGGQLKRVNIAVELVALSSPALLLLDEPTAGLDASIAYDLIVSLETVMRHKGITILAVLQQPRAEIFSKIDHLFLMNDDGHVVYEGPSSEVVGYLTSIGFVKPAEDTADADFCIDVLNGLADRVDAGDAQLQSVISLGAYSSNSASNNIELSKTVQRAGTSHQQQQQQRELDAQQTRSQSRSAGFEEFSLVNAWAQHCKNRSLVESGLETANQTPVITPSASRAGSVSSTVVSASPQKQMTSNPLLSPTRFRAISPISLHVPFSALPTDDHDDDDDENSSSANENSSSGVCSNIYVANFIAFARLCKLNAMRLFKIRFRNVRSMLIYFMINFIMACALSSGFSILMTESYLSILAPPTRTNLQDFYPSPLADYKENNVNDFSIAQLVFFMSSSLGCASCLSSVPVFAGQLSLLKREHSAGMSVFAYAVGRMTADLLFVVFNAMIFTGTWMVFGHAGGYYNWMGTIICTAFAASGIGYITSAWAKQNNASVYAIIATFICCVFNGSEPTLADVSKFPVVSWPWYISFATWTSEATYITWSQYLTNDGHVSDPVQEGADQYGYEVDNGLGRPIGALIALGFSMRIFATLILYYKVKTGK